MFKVSQVAKDLGVKENTIYTWIREGKLKVNRLGSGERASVRITQEQLNEFMST